MKRKKIALDEMKERTVREMRAVLLAQFRARSGSRGNRLRAAAAEVNRRFPHVNYCWRHEVEWWGMCNLL